MNLDLDVMQAAHENSLMNLSNLAFGEEGERAARSLLKALPRIHQRVPVEMLPNGLVVFVAIDETYCLAGQAAATPSLDSVVAYPHDALTIQVSGDGYRLVHERVAIDALPSAVSYSFSQPSSEHWHLAGDTHPVFNPLPDQPSSFATPLFTELEEALSAYAVRKVLHCRCSILQDGWLSDDRVFWRQRPEEQIRRSLEHHLDSALRAVVVEVEHVVDETKEADIHVHWPISNRAALIECKWMGVSASAPDGEGARRITRMGPQDAREGLTQVADYLDRKRPRSVDRSYMGYLVVIDGRRHGASHPDNGRVLTQAELLEFEHKEVEGWPDDALGRTDIRHPYRMFCRPKI